MASINESHATDQNGVPLNEPSICIPRVFSNISDRRIFAIFRELRMGFVEKIDLVPRVGKDGKEYNMVFVHFRNWFTNDVIATAMRNRLLGGEQVKIVYDEPWFWKVHAYEPKKQTAATDGDARRSAPFVDFEFREAFKPQTGSRPQPPSRPAPSRKEPEVKMPAIYSALDVADDDETDETVNTVEQSSSLSHPMWSVNRGEK